MQRVLVVEDDADIRGTIRLILEEAGYVVDEAADGRPALRLLRAAREHLVALVDLRMPGMDGRQLLEVLAAEEPLAHQHAFVLITANDNTLPLSFVNLLASLQTPILRKPFDMDALLGVVSAAATQLAHRS